jgi:DNA-binding NtrC family response regulator
MSTSTFLPISLQSFPPDAACGASLPSAASSALAEQTLIGSSAATTRLRLQVRRIGPHFRSVLIQGASGTGKQTVAYALHRTSPVSDGPFLTSASGARVGYLVKLAQRGTLYLDRIDRMTLAAQDEMLDALERSEWAGNGLASPSHTCPRLIASATQDLSALASAGRFRQQLFHRLSTVQIALPSLTDRIEDIPLLAAHFLSHTAQGRHKEIALSEDAMTWLRAHSWPGNLRELKSLLENAALHAESGSIRAKQLTAVAEASAAAQTDAHAAAQPAFEPARLQDVIEKHVLHVLKSCAGNKLRAAELLGISRSTLYRMLDTCSAAGA